MIDYKKGDRLVVKSLDMHNRKVGDIVYITSIYIAYDNKDCDIQFFQLDNGYVLYGSEGIWDISKHCLLLKEYRKKKLERLKRL
jgi:hypothetical protein